MVRRLILCVSVFIFSFGSTLFCFAQYTDNEYLESINSKTYEFNQNFLDYWQWYIDYLDYNQHYTLANTIQYAMDNSSSLNDIRDNSYYTTLELQTLEFFLNSYGEYSSLSDVLSQFQLDLLAGESILFQEFFGTGGGLSTSIGGVSTSINDLQVYLEQDLSKIIDNQEKQIDYQKGIYTNVFNLAEYFINASDSNIDFTYESSQVNSTSSSLVDDSMALFYSSTTNLSSISSEYEIKDTQFDFSTFTNFSDRVDVINNDYNLSQILSQTNLLLTATESLQSEINNQFHKLESFTQRKYSSVIVWRAFVEEPIELNLKNYLDNSFDFRTIWDFVIWVLTIFYSIKFLRMIWGDNDDGE